MSSTEPTVIVIGDLMLDRWLAGDMLRFSVEDPTAPLLSVADQRLQPGGAANVAANIAALGRRVQLVGAVGPDPDGILLDSLLQALPNIWPRVLVAGSEFQTLVKTRGTTHGRQLFRYDTGLQITVPQNLLINAIGQAFQSAPIGAVVFSDYNKGLLTAESRRFIITECQRLGVPVYVDAKPAVFQDYTNATVLTPNLHEAAAGSAACSHPGTVSPDILDRAVVFGDHLRVLLKLEAVVTTCGDKGATVSLEGARHECKVESIFQGEPAGAGDTFLAALVVARMAGDDWPQATTAANIAAGLAVGQPYTAIVSRSAWQAKRWALSHHLRVEELQEFGECAKKNYQRVVFTNGVFDILHSGHLAMLEQAKQRGELLVVGVNSDESVRRLKGEGRPRLPLEQRVRQLQQLRTVDAVVVFDEDTPESIIRKLKPDTLVKGSEYVTQSVPGADYVASRGGDVFFAPMLPGVSTTNLVG